MKSPIDLSKLPIGRKKSDKKPAAESVIVTSVVLAKKADNEEVRKAIVAAGFSVDTVLVQKAEDGEAVVFKQSDEEGDSAVRITDDMVVVCKGLYYDSIPATFQDRLNANVYGAMNLAVGALQDALWDAMYEAKSVDELKGAGSNIIDEFSTYMKALLGKIPASIVKLETGMRDAELTLAAIQKGEGDEPAPAAAPEAAAPATDAPADDAAPVEAAAPATEAAPAAAPEGGEPAPVVKNEKSELEVALEKALSPITERLGAIENSQKESVQKTEEALAAVKEEVKVAKDAVDSVQKVVKGTVLGKPATDAPAPVVTQKNEGDESSVQDTAYKDDRKRRI